MARKIRSDKGKTHRKYEDDIYRAMAKYGDNFWLNSRDIEFNEKNAKQLIATGKLYGIHENIRGYMEDNPNLTAKEATKAFANSSAYTTGRQRIEEFAYKTVRDLKGWVINKKNINYEETIVHNGERFTKYSFTAYGKTYYLYEYADNSPKEGSNEYLPIINTESWT